MNKSFTRNGFFTTLLLVLLSFGLANAQEFRATVTGTVKDPNEAIIPGATVTITNVETNVAASASTNDEGVYTFPLLQPGKYKLLATAQNFQTSVRNEIQLNIDDRLTIDIQLTVGAAAEVNISADTELIERGSVSSGTVITERQITELPLSEGAAYNLQRRHRAFPTREIRISPVRPPTATSPHFARTARAATKSRSTGRRTSVSTAESPTRRRRMRSRNLKSRQTPLTRKTVSPPVRPLTSRSKAAPTIFMARLITSTAAKP